MTMTNRSLIAITLATLLAGCGSDSKPTVPFPTDPEPLVPDEPQEISVLIGETTIKATKESLVITSNNEADKIGYVESFKGIKFAEADRFVHSEIVPLSGSVDTAVDATEFGAACPQLKDTQQEQSEDCLNLNIWRPLDSNADEALPVYVFIHGGDFEYGSGSEPLIQGDTVVAQGASEDNPFIYVSFNYRLGLLGSMWVDDEKGGNFGIGDQKRALEWVNENIAQFGGNPENVTLMGQGAGAMSVGVLQQADVNNNIVTDKNYFARTVMQSNPYGYDFQSSDSAENDAIDICEELGTTTTKTSLNVIKTGLQALLLTDVLSEDAKAILEPIVDDMPTWTENVICADNSIAQLQELDLPTIMSAQQDQLADPINKTVGWLSDSILGVISSDRITPMNNFMPFAPYIDSYETCFLTICTAHPGENLTNQPVINEFTRPTVIGNNAKDSNTMSMLPTLTFLIPKIIGMLESDIDDGAFESIDDNPAINLAVWLQIDDNKQRVIDTLSELSVEEVNAEIELGDLLDILPSTAYEAVTKLFLGLGNSEMNNELLELTDYAPWSENELDGATKNMSQFKMLMNDMLFQAPARNQAIKSSQNAENTATLYHFAFSPSFNVWSYDTNELDIGDVLKSVACISGSCKGSELPFIFNKAYKFDGSEVHPTSKDRTLMNDLSRLWFNDSLFTDYQYEQQSDNVLSVDSDGNISQEFDWDTIHNEGTDSRLRDGRLQGLNNQGLTLKYMPDYEIPAQN
ncbi:carboxylesterase family protein [Vibrio sp. FNV 38]|nr:carboxylesterase family protein [Vibrio sp. FNV 38]